MKIISGGQTGVDRAALDVALELGLECGGWVPRGRRDEVGQIPALYPVLELDSADPAARTRQNVKESDGTIAFFFAELHGGTGLAVQCCIEERKPHLSIDASLIAPERAGELIQIFIPRKNLSTINVAGPRQSDWPEGYDYARRALEIGLQAKP